MSVPERERKTLCDMCHVRLCTHRVLQGVYCGEGYRLCDDCLPKHLDRAIDRARLALRVADAPTKVPIRRIVVYVLKEPGYWRGGASFARTLAQITVKTPSLAVFP